MTDINQTLRPLNIPKDLSNALDEYITSVKSLLGENIAHVILHGSLSSGDFHEKSSDVDLLIVTHKALKETDFYLLSHLHNSFKLHNKVWAEKFEISYVSLEEFYELTPPKLERIYLSKGVTKLEPYGAEWYIEKYIIEKHGRLLYGDDIDRSLLVVSSTKLRVASYQILMDWWQPIINRGLHRLDDDYLIYGVLSMCRIFMTIESGEVASKENAVQYIINNMSSDYDVLIQAALNNRLNDRQKAFDFIKLIVERYV